MDFIIDGSGLNINELYLLLKSGSKLLLSKDIRNRIQDNRHYLESKIDDPGAVIYGILNEKQQNDREIWYMIDSSFITTLPDTWGIGEKFLLLPINGQT